MKFTIISLLALNCRVFSIKTRIKIPGHLYCINHIQKCNSVIPTFFYFKDMFLLNYNNKTWPQHAFYFRSMN